MPPTTHGDGLLPYVTVRDTIEHYPAIEAGETNNDYFNHHASALSQTNLDRIIATPHDGGGRLDWSARLILNCHNDDYRGHTDVYGRMSWDDVSPTLTSKCFSLSNGRFGHPEQNRAISLREAAAIQSFDDNYQFFGSVQEIGKQIGNAVPERMDMPNYIADLREGVAVEYVSCEPIPEVTYTPDISAEARKEYAERVMARQKEKTEQA